MIDNLRSHFKELSLVKEKLPNHPLGVVAKARAGVNSTSFTGRSSRGLKIVLSRRRMLEKIQKDHYVAPITHLNEIDK